MNKLADVINLLFFLIGVIPYTVGMKLTGATNGDPVDASKLGMIISLIAIIAAVFAGVYWI